MKNIQSLLERFTKALNRGQFEKEIIASVIKDKTGITIDTNNLFFKNGVLEINSSPVVKSEIMIKEELVARDLRDLHQIFISRMVYK